MYLFNKTATAEKILLQEVVKTITFYYTILPNIISSIFLRDILGLISCDTNNEKRKQAYTCLCNRHIQFMISQGYRMNRFAI